MVDDVPCSIIDAKPGRPLLRGGTVTLFQTLDGVGAFAIAMHTRCGAWSALQGMLVRRMHASRSVVLQGSLHQQSKISSTLPST